MEPDYVTDVPFVRQFTRQLSPTVLRAAAALAGFRAPSDDAAPLAYCEVGCGLGDTLCTLAAAYPESRFVGIDINPEHIAFARALADRGALHNITFLENDFEDLGGPRPELADLDFVCAHGLLSWIAPAKRRALAAFAAARLKSGGVLHVSYNAMPGWAAVQPLRRLLRDAAGDDGSRVFRARRALDAAHALQAAGARYFADNPSAAEMLATMTRIGPEYVVHEYFHDHWNPMHSADVMAEMAAEGLRFCGEATLYRNVPRLALPRDTAALVAAAGAGPAGEALKDLATNVFLRGDLYAKTRAGADPSATAEYLETTPLGSLVPADRVRRDVQLPNATLAMHGEPFDTILAHAARRPASLRELHAALPGFSMDRLREAAVDLIAAEQLFPARASWRTSAADAHEYNLSVLRQPLSKQRPSVLASPVLGTGVEVPSLQAVCLRLVHLIAPGERARAIREYVATQSLKLYAGDRSITEPEEQATVIEGEFERFLVQRLPKLVALGVVRSEAAAGALSSARG